MYDSPAGISHLSLLLLQQLYGIIPSSILDLVFGYSETSLCIHEFFLKNAGTPKYLHGAESFLRSPQVLSQSRNSRHFMEPEGSLPYSQELATCPYPEPDQTFHAPIPTL